MDRRLIREAEEGPHLVFAGAPARGEHGAQTGRLGREQDVLHAGVDRCAKRRDPGLASPERVIGIDHNQRGYVGPWRALGGAIAV